MILSITIDYELFGDGSGNVFEHMIKPTQTILDLLNQNNIKSTIFFEVIEYWKIKKEYESGKHMGYKENPAKAIKNQLQEAYLNGHDIQLHLHPQWVNAKFENNMWEVDERFWRISDVPLVPTDDFPFSLHELIIKGKSTIEAIIQSVDPSYRCNIFRAGGYNISPSLEVLKVLRENGFIADSSVYAGGYQDTSLSKYDYRNIRNNIPYWYCYESIETGGIIGKESDFIELPIYAENMSGYKKIDLIRIRAGLKNRKSTINKFNNKAKEKSVIQRIKYLIDSQSVTWDFCLFNKSKMSRYLKNAKRICLSSNYPVHPFVIIGHPKDFISNSGLKYLLKRTKKYSYNTLTEIVKIIQDGSR